MIACYPIQNSFLVQISVVDKRPSVKDGTARPTVVGWILSNWRPVVMGVDDRRSPVLGENESDDSKGTRERVIGAMVRDENVGCRQPQK